jgi:hypothetical protein
MMNLRCLNAVVLVSEVLGSDGSCQSAKHSNTDPLLRIVGFVYIMHFRLVSRTHNARRDVSRCYRHYAIYIQKYHVFKN